MKPMSEKLSSFVTISPQFSRSIRIDMDYGRQDALDGYICQGTALHLLENISLQILKTKQRAFTWTGPYGGGKSSLALLLCSLVSPDKSLRDKAKNILNLPSNSPIIQAFYPGQQGWMVIPIVGNSDSIINRLAISLSNLTDVTFSKPPSGSEVIKSLVNFAESKKHEGVLVVIDELGKFLETAAQSNEDVFFYQELAEAASRCRGTLIVVGVLHQAFEQYASRLGRESRDEWAKVQGRFSDIPLVAASDEVVELISRAITLSKGFFYEEFQAIVEVVVEAIKRRRPGSPAHLKDGLRRCWPIHPITATLLGPISKRKFSQNERSTFAFLSSREPLGFLEFLDGIESSPLALYGPAHLWDYLKANLEPSILASSDGHRWSSAAEAVERAESRASKIHIDLVKTIALLDMFRNGSGLAAEEKVLKVALPYAHPGEIQKALEELAHWSIIIYRKHLMAWSIYAGSDFDIEDATRKARNEISELDLNRFIDLSGLLPVLAKRHYQITGTMRWFTKSILNQKDAEQYFIHYHPRDGSCGEFVLVVPSEDSSKEFDSSFARKLSQYKSPFPLIVSLPKNAAQIAESAKEIMVLQKVLNTNSNLDGDTVARREIQARISVLKDALEEELQTSFDMSHWYYKGNLLGLNTQKGLSSIASKIAEDLYPQTPHLLNELINRNRPSTNAIKARRDLLYRMLAHDDEENLGYAGYPADASLYYALLKKTTIHRQTENGWQFAPPTLNDEVGKTILPLWEATTGFIAHSDKMTSLEDLYTLWSAPPFGLRDGVMPILALAFFLANRQNLALYIEGVFIPDLTEPYLDEWLQDASRIVFRYVEIGEDRKKMLLQLSKTLNKHLINPISPNPLDSARALVALVLRLPGWTKRSTTLSAHAQMVRDLLLKASDPHKVLFIDLPTILSVTDPQDLTDAIIQAISELEQAYPILLRSVESKLFKVLDLDGNLDDLHRRAETVKGISGNFLLESFATRLATYTGSAQDIEGLISLAVNKPARDWGDRDIEAAIIQLGNWSLDFRRVETLAPLQNRHSTRRAIAVIFGTENNHSVSQILDISKEDLLSANALATEFLKVLKKKNIKREVFLAALAEAGVQTLETIEEKD